MKVLSLFDGMSCGVLAMIESGVGIDRYVAYKIDKYAIQTSTHNFPFIEQRGDVFKADFTEFEGFDWLVGGSPCTYWSIAQTNNRETTASGMGWELFSQYVRALHEAKPKYFIYENNKSMSKAIRESIDEAFGFEAVLINSALVSAQNRQRLYWVGRRNDDGTYSKVDVPQPQDRGILLKDILETGLPRYEKSHCIDANYYKGGNLTRFECQSGQRMMACEPVRIPDYGPDKARPINAYYPNNCGGFEQRIWSENPNKQQVDMIAEPVRVGCMPSPDGEVKGSQAMRVYDSEGKSVNLSANGGGAGGKTGLYAVPVNTTVNGYAHCIKAGYYKQGMANFVTNPGHDATAVAEQCPCFAVPTEWDEEGRPTKARSCADGKIYTVYEVKDGRITINGKEYPIKLPDGFYIIRKLTVRECMRLQTVPEWYEFPVSDSQAYKMLGNGWTVAVISWLIHCVFNNER